MAKKNPISPLLTPSGCLTSQTIRRYLEGNLSPEDQYSVMDHLDTCRFCQDAAEGLARVKNSRVTDREIASLNKQILERTSAATSRRLHPSVRKISMTKTWTYAAAAASVLLLVSIYFLLQQSHPEYQESMIAFNDTIRKDADQMRPNEPIAVPDSRKFTAQESIRSDTPPSDEQALPETEPEAVIIAEEADVLADGLISSGEATPLTDSTVPVHQTDQSVVVEMKAAEEPPSVIEGITVGGVSARKEKSTYRTVVADIQMPQEEGIFTIVEQMPEFPGGNDSLSAFLRKNLHYPEEALDPKTEGTVYLTFVVEKDGSVSDIRLLRGVSDTYNTEAIRLVNSMPRWIPGRQHSVPVRVQFTLPIQFKLPHEQ